MKYEHIMAYVANALWAIDHDKMREILGVLALRAAGGEFTPEEIKARIGDSEAAVSNQRGVVGVIPLRGVIANRMGGMNESSGGMSVERFRALFRQAMSTDSIHSIIVDVDSPGGTVAGVPEMAAEMLAARGTKPIIAQVDALCASAGYWLAACCDEIVATPSSLVGSVGIFTVREDVSEALEKAGVKVNVISAGKHKAESMPFFPLSEDARAHIQAQVDEAYDQFVKAVAAGRKVSPADVRNGYGKGRVISAKDALAEGMIDRIATLDQTVARLSTHQGRSRVGMKAEADTYDLSDAAATIQQIEIDAELAKEETGANARELEAARLLQAQLLMDKDRAVHIRIK